ncbi:hypothetical protein [Candidatus Enterovibrio escicola]|uniref:Uncharacterized protein n=1 Tax=Candidatus Enterovibrio escicola TaxID=1927127 RepID=A0A2A5T7Y5_9GAMM|nr:hypothetical protein [Candidatus Enterovibrio escacola]PCS24264.1 hypothetical protein BTN49_0082 [Candidatus Enterovibrio escacola]
MHLQLVSHVNASIVAITTMDLDENNAGDFTRIYLKVRLNKL